MYLLIYNILYFIKHKDHIGHLNSFKQFKSENAYLTGLTRTKLLSQLIIKPLI